MADFASKLQLMMQRANIPNWKALQRLAGISERQVLRLRRGEVGQMRVEVLLKVARVLQVSFDELLIDSVVDVEPGESEKSSLATKHNPQETTELTTNQESIRHDLQREILDLMESLLVQFPIAAAKARENPNLAASKIVPLVENPLKKLLTAWEITEIANVGATIAYNPQYHQIREGTAQPGDLVIVRSPGYLQKGRLIYRAQVSRC
ncbi:XRE family transcriptional regulator [Calothrix sp. NIES-3974]|uniref:XRE family transcriptional regulator n=1 Tax=Calothrix sp. NIES-3974 TaxID=2005462 RepID=UPI000B61B9C4|nr:XRE family transcriptional regulator [Calothrix sp. NIES-3974]BAZ06734.1 hypothetical protein NIES3974_33960 [Calothrix sp. NIES-3974]